MDVIVLKHTPYGANSLSHSTESHQRTHHYALHTRDSKDTTESSNLVTVAGYLILFGMISSYSTVHSSTEGIEETVRLKKLIQHIDIE